MTAEVPRDDNLRLILAPAEKQKIDDLWRRAWTKLAFGFGIAVAAFACVWFREFHFDVYESLPKLVQAPVVLIPGVALVAFPIVAAAAAWDAIRAWRFRREFEAFHRSYGRDPSAVKMPKSWTVE